MAIFKTKDTVSEEDTLLRALEAKRANTLTANQRDEVVKHEKVAKLRDHALKQDKAALWEDF